VNQAKIQENRSALVGEEDVGGLDVPVDQASGVDHLQGSGNLEEGLDRVRNLSRGLQVFTSQ
jgi:hypothetical protein